jgi:hypothetical protein
MTDKTTVQRIQEFRVCGGSLAEGKDMITNLHVRHSAARLMTDFAIALPLVGIDAVARLTPFGPNSP